MLAYAKSHRHDNTMPFITWSTDGEVVTFQGKQFSMTAYRSMVRSVVASVVEAASRLTFCTVVDARVVFTPRRLKDNLQWRDAGASFITHSDNRFPELGVEAAIHRLYTLDWARRWVLDRDGGFSERGRGEFLSEVVAFERLLMCAHHFTCGGLPRGTEAFSVNHSNTATSLRGVFVDQGKLFTLTSYHKNIRATGTPKMIARYPAYDVAVATVAYLTTIRPLTTMLTRDEERGLRLQKDSRLFRLSNDDVWDTAALSKELTRHTEVHLNGSFGVADYRHLSIAIRTRCVPGQGKQDTPEDPTNEVAAMQSGHGARIEQEIYAPTTTLLAGLDDKLLVAFERTSRAYHAWCGLEPLELAQTAPTLDGVTQ